jgi:hypothetical protein
MVFKSTWDNDLILSDVHLPFENERALDEAKYLKKHFRVAPERVYCTGDFLDQYNASQWPKDPEAEHTAKTEWDDTKKKIKEWVKAFPAMKIALGNHDLRWMRKATACGFPSILFKTLNEICGLPSSWEYKDLWVVKGKQLYHLEHGDAWGTNKPHIQAALHKGVNVALGHWHSYGGVNFIDTKHEKKPIWAAIASCNIQREKYAFHYAKKAKLKPINGNLVIADSGRLPIYIPYHLK